MKRVTIKTPAKGVGLHKKGTTFDIFEAVARGEITAEQGAEIMMQERESKTMKTTLWNFLKSLNRSKVVNGVGAFFALAIPVLVVVGQNLPNSWKVTLLIASAIGVLTRAQYIFQKVVPLLDGSEVVQVKPPAAGVLPALLSVASDPGQVTTNTASVVPIAPMQTGDVPGKVLPMQTPTPVTRPETPSSKGTP